MTQIRGYSIWTFNFELLRRIRDLKTWMRDLNDLI
jgi:hypothetical protein